MLAPKRRAVIVCILLVMISVVQFFKIDRHALQKKKTEPVINILRLSNKFFLPLRLVL
jgi:hypothetical protein